MKMHHHYAEFTDITDVKGLLIIVGILNVIFHQSQVK